MNKMSESSLPIINISALDQVCLVVRDLDRSMEMLWKTFGIGPWDTMVNNANSMTDMTYYGKPARFGFKIARTRNKLGGMEIELIQSIEGDNIYSDFLREHGEGVHHLGWYKVDSLEAFDKITQTLEKAGFPCIMSGRKPKVAFAYFDTTKVLNTMLEMLWKDTS
jgi:methylmalonyl-CoA/ethylmalonyl-CoA epimerase